MVLNAWLVVLWHSSCPLCGNIYIQIHNIAQIRGSTVEEQIRCNLQIPTGEGPTFTSTTWEDRPKT